MYLKNKMNNERIQRLILLFLVMFSLFFIELQFLSLINLELNLSNTLFSLSFICLFSALILFTRKKISLILYILIYSILYLFLITHVIYYTIMNSYFGISEIFYAGEGMEYLNVILQIINIKFILLFIINLILFILTVSAIKKYNISNKELKKKLVFFLIVISLILRFDAVLSLGHFTQINELEDYSSMRYIYEKWNDRSKCTNISGIYEYTFRDIYVLLRNKFSFNKDKGIDEINNYFKDNYRVKSSNDYTGIFKNKNVIMVQLESIDNWLVTEKNMPTLTNLEKTGIDFVNRYAPSMGGGNTYNTEYSVNTGLYIPINGYNIYDSINNNYSVSLPNLFKNQGYSVNSIHFNQGSFYDRVNMHKTFGYDNHYALMDMGYSYQDVVNDEFLIDNDDIYNLIVPSSDKFMSYVITYSAHVPYIDNQLCKTHDYPELEIDGDEALTCINKLSRITDDFLKKLIDRLDHDSKLDNTVLVLFSDHYAYGYDTSYIEKIKGGSSKSVLEHVPFVIWSKDIQNNNVESYLATNDILPTVANLFNLDYNPNNYIGSDVFSDYHDNYVYFNNYTWVGTNDNILGEINKKIDINDYIIKSNYYNTHLTK